jgi:hypothetical protein
MKTLYALLLTAVIVMSFSGCGSDSPVASADVRPESAQFDGGVMYGSGNNTAADSVGATAAVQDGGVMYGSGN